MLKFLSKYEGKDLDDTIKWVKDQKEFSTTQILESTPEAKVDLNEIIYQQGTFTIHYFTNSYDDSYSSPINLDVIFLDDGVILQRYNYHENVVQRFKSEGIWTDWGLVKNFLTVGETDPVNVNVDTLVLRKIDTPVEEFFNSGDSE